MFDADALDAAVRAWLQDLADREHGGDFAAANRSILRAAFLAEQAPGDLWAYLNARTSTPPRT